jgi:hypothetical protein
VVISQVPVDHKIHIGSPPSHPTRLGFRIADPIDSSYSNLAQASKDFTFPSLALLVQSKAPFLRFVRPSRAVVVSLLLLALVVAVVFLSYCIYVPAGTATPYTRRLAAAHAKASNVVIVGLAHNIARPIAATLPLLTAMSSYFNTTRYIIYENDSTDGTKEVLSEWHKNHPSKQSISLFLDTLNEQSANSLGGFSQRRFDRLAAYRNRYMEVLARAEYADADYVIVMDLDINGFSPGAFLAAMTPEALSRDWAAAGAFGTRWKFGLHVPAPTYYDTLAFRDAQFRTPFTYEQRQAASWWLYKHQADGWLPANSFFGGQVIYRYKCIAQCRYAGGDCEHVALYDCMRKTPGCGNFFVVPEYRLSYGLF